MSRLNKVNPDHYKVGGRLTPDELARERSKQRAQRSTQSRKGGSAPPTPRTAPWAPTGVGSMRSSPSIGTRKRKRKA